MLALQDAHSLRSSVNTPHFSARGQRDRGYSGRQLASKEAGASLNCCSGVSWKFPAVGWGLLLSRQAVFGTWSRRIIWAQQLAVFQDLAAA